MLKISHDKTEIEKINNIFERLENETIPDIETVICLEKIDNQKLQEMISNFLDVYNGWEATLYSSIITSFLDTFGVYLKESKTVLTEKEKNIVDELSNKWQEITRSKKVRYIDYYNFKKDVMVLLNFSLSTNKEIDEDKIPLKILEYLENVIGVDEKETRINNLRVLINSFFRKIHNTSILITDPRLSKVEPLDFEYLVARLFNLMGYETKVTPGSGDYGIDIIAQKDGEVIAIQCKKYNESIKVSNRDIQMFLGAMQLKGYPITRGIFITTSDFTDQAHRQADGNKIELWNGRKIEKMVHNYILQDDNK